MFGGQGLAIERMGKEIFFSNEIFQSQICGVPTIAVEHDMGGLGLYL
jgi:hypothetical protein